MNDSEIIHHPLDRFSFTGDMGNLDTAGRDAADKLTTMIGDMRFMKDSISGFCARYFLLIDATWFPKLCLSAQINSAMLRFYLWRVQSGEVDELANAAEAVQIDFSFLKNDPTPLAIVDSKVETLSEWLSTDHSQVITQMIGSRRPIQKHRLMRIRALLLETDQSSASETKL
jgi:hypothetical protein